MWAPTFTKSHVDRPYLGSLTKILNDLQHNLFHLNETALVNQTTFINNEKYSIKIINKQMIKKDTFQLSNVCLI